LRGITGEIFVGYFEEDFRENIDHYTSRFEFLGCYKSTPLKRNLVL
jgi:hypothetical protein